MADWLEGSRIWFIEFCHFQFSLTMNSTESCRDSSVRSATQQLLVVPRHQLSSYGDGLSGCSWASRVQTRRHGVQLPARSSASVPRGIVLTSRRCCITATFSIIRHTALGRTASPAELLWPTGFLCGWSVGLEFRAGQLAESDWREQFQTISEDIKLFAMYWCIQRIRGFTTMRYINRLVTYLLTYLLTNAISKARSNANLFLKFDGWLYTSLWLSILFWLYIRSIRASNECSWHYY